MIVCVCHRVSERDIHRAVHAGCTSFAELQQELGVATGCGTCGDCARDTFCAAQAKSATVVVHRHGVPAQARHIAPPTVSA